MAIRANTATLSTTASLVFTAENGHADAPQTVIVKNTHATITVYVGGEDVATTLTGFSIAPGVSLSIDMIAGDKLWMVATSGTPVVELLYNRV